jgi:hypothetical protein
MMVCDRKHGSCSECYNGTIRVVHRIQHDSHVYAKSNSSIRASIPRQRSIEWEKFTDPISK